MYTPHVTPKLSNPSCLEIYSTISLFSMTNLNVTRIIITPSQIVDT